MSVSQTAGSNLFVNTMFLQLIGHPSADLDLTLSREVNR